MRLNKLVAIIEIIIISLTICYPVYGSMLELFKQMEELREQGDEVKEKLGEVYEKKAVTMSEIEEVDAELNKSAEELKAIDERMKAITQMLVRTEAELTVARKEKDVQQEIFKRRARNMYMYGKAGYLSVILQAESVGEMLNRFEYINRIVKHDNDLVQRLKEIELSITDKAKKIAAHKSDIKSEQDKKQSELDKLEGLLAKKKEVYVALSKDADSFEKQLKDLEKADREIADMILKAYEEELREKELMDVEMAKSIASYARTKGELNWPVPGHGRISSPYGGRINPISGSSEFHTGIDIPGPSGTFIVSSEDGVVVYAGSGIRGYGNSMLVDHGGGISTFYAHCSELGVTSGDVVERGQPIGRVGSTGYSTGPHLHYEVRLKGNTANPLNFLQNKTE